MSSENGVPMEVCPKCGSNKTPISKCFVAKYDCGSYENDSHQSSTCKQIAQLKTEIKEKDQRIAELEAECERLNIEIKRIRKTAGNMFDSGVAFSVWDRFDGGIHRPFNKEEALKHNGLGE